MEVDGGAPSDILLQRPWFPVSVGGCRLLAKTWFGDSEYHVLLSDMICVWEERMDTAAIQSRAQELNRRLRAPVRAFFSHLRQVVQPSLSGGGGRLDDDAQISLTRGEDGNISLKLRSELAGLPFYWEFHCTPAPVTMVCAQLVRPLLDMSRLLQRQVEQLGALLLRKDAEIQDYRENGATLSRERLQTDVFEEQTYREDFMSKALPLVCSRHQDDDALGFGANLQLLYAAIAAHTNTRKRKAPEEEEEEEEEERPAATQEPDISQSFGGGSVITQSAESDKDLSHNGQSAETTGAKMADKTAAQQSAAVTSKPAERTQSKPKKKKVGLFG